MTIDAATARREVRTKIIEIASRTTIKTPTLGDDDVIPETGLLDPAAISELVGWIDTRFGLHIDQRDLTTVNAIVNYLEEHARPMA